MPRSIRTILLRTVPLCFAVCAFAIDSASAQTGTITGTVTDATGAGVPYASVLLGGTKLGGRANAEGAYTIVKVPVGTYTLRTRAVGYAPAERTGVTVDAGRASRIDFRLVEQAVRIPVTEVIVDRKYKVDTKTETKHITEAEVVRSLPFNTLQETLELTAGVVSQGGEMHFRGGRADEVLTIVDGIASRNPLSAEGVDLGLLSVSSVEQVLGGMDAQYGNALSGVVNYTTREGGRKFSGEARYFTDRYGEADKSFTNFERLSTGFGGPFALPNTSYFVSFEGTYSDTHLRSVAGHREHRFLDLVRIGPRQSNDAKLSGKVTFQVTPDKKLNLEVVRNSTLDGTFNNRWNRQGYVSVTQDSTPPTDGGVSTRYGDWSYYPIDSTYVPMNTAEHLPVTEEDYLQTSVSWKHTVGRSSIYNVRVSRQEWKTSQDVLDREPWEYQQQPNNYYDAGNRIDGPYYVTNGDYPFFERRRTVTYTVNGDLSRRIGPHEFMAGGDLNYNDLGFLRTDFPNVIAGTGLYGLNRDEFRYYNPEGSFFVQDRWKYEGLVLNAGVRYDNFSVGSQLSSEEVSDRVKTQISPRIGIAYPVSERDVMSFYYGRLFQVPDRQYIYQGRLPSSTARGNPNLEPQTTISYQMGVQHLFSSEVYGQFGVYFKDIYGLLTTVPQAIPGFATTALTYVNGDYASARGIEFTLSKKFRHGFGGELNYTYGHATGTASDPNRALPNRGNLRDQFKPTSEQPLRWDQRHTFTATLNLGNERDWRTAFVYQFGSGLPYTPHEREERRQDPELVFSERLPSTSTLSMQGERSFRAWGQDLTLYVQATNLLDADNIGTLQPALWPPGAINEQAYEIYYTETHRAGGAFLIPDQDGDGREDWFPVHDPRVFNPGRTIRVGLGLQF